MMGRGMMGQGGMMGGMMNHDGHCQAAWACREHCNAMMQGSEGRAAERAVAGPVAAAPDQRGQPDKDNVEQRRWTPSRRPAARAP